MRIFYINGQIGEANVAIPEWLSPELRGLLSRLLILEEHRLTVCFFRPVFQLVYRVLGLSFGRPCRTRSSRQKVTLG